MEKEKTTFRFNEPIGGKFVMPHHARMLKALGFDWPVRSYYFKEFSNKKTMALRTIQVAENHNDPDLNQTEFCSAPSLYTAAKWLREEKGIFVEVLMRGKDKFEVVGKVYLPKRCPSVVHLFDLWDVEQGIVFPTYEIALMYGIGFALHLLKDKIETK